MPHGLLLRAGWPGGDGGRSLSGTGDGVYLDGRRRRLQRTRL